MGSNSLATLALKLLVIGLFALTVVATYTISRSAGPAAAIPSLVGIYLSICLGVGVFITSLLDPRFQVAFAAGLAALGGSLYLTGRPLLGAVLAGVGLFVLGTKGRELTG
ncbi:MAG: hypothetical protein QXG03_07055 [Halalkalicoccus sp.]